MNFSSSEKATGFCWRSFTYASFHSKHKKAIYFFKIGRVLLEVGSFKEGIKYILYAYLLEKKLGNFLKLIKFFIFGVVQNIKIHLGVQIER